MSLSPGARLGPYEILAAIGAGGMGEVYRARDTRLHREIAVKVLPALFASDPDRRTRFEREAQAVAALSHPHILALHDVGVHDGIAYAVTELLEGETLRERLSSGPLLVRKAVDYGVQIARGLAAAHGKGIVHRDLKPENIFLVAGGQLKILDFGLARSMVHDEGSTMALQTEPGTVLGTVGYMAPEQVRGQSIDPRTDLFAFGAVLYEMLSGTRAFQRETPAETMTAILHEEPPELTGIRAALPPALDRIVRHCLEKNPGDRFQSATDVAFALDALSGSSSQPLPGGPGVALTSQDGAASRARSSLKWVLACGASALAAAWIVWSVRPPTARASAYLAIPLPAGDALEDHGVPLLALTPDGSALVYAAVRGGVQRLFRRPLDDFRADPIPDTEGASMPFFSADGKWIGFFTQGKLRKVPLDGGAPPVDVADAPDGRGASWARDGTIAFVPHLFAAISRIASSSGAKPEPLAKLEIHHWPDMLPDGRTVVYAVGGHDLVTWDDAQIVAQPLGGATGGFSCAAALIRGMSLPVTFCTCVAARCWPSNSIRRGSKSAARLSQ